MNILNQNDINSLQQFATADENESENDSSIDGGCFCTGNCGQSCAGGCEAGCTGDCARSCSGSAQ